ncbi:MAG TPA: outer membrane protein assembly factor BamD [Casimicrobiaceae bacterium]|nr:outer membrane protein assembly factor BamD [Casimicrobiaceae bacterium]
MSKIGWSCAALVTGLLVTGCGWLPEVKDETADWSAEKLYDEAHTMMVTGNYTRAIKLFDTLEGRFPYGRHAQQAILEGAYSNYRFGETAAAVAACDRFIRTYPNNASVDYAYYLKGVVNFREDQGIFGWVVEQDLSERDPKLARESYNAFRDLVTRFPDSRYAEDSTQRMRYLVNALAMYEVHVANYYYNRGAYLAAANRAYGALVNYPQTPANEDALILLVYSYDKLGLPQLGDDAKRILQSTYPKGKYFVPGPPPWWQFWGRDSVFQLLEKNTVPKSKADEGGMPPP